MNLLQTAIETLLFYHPAVWWLSGRIREERELCCDDLAVAACGDGMVYARALATMEELRSAPALTLAAGGRSLLARIRRIAAGSSPVPDRTPAALTLSGFAVVSVAACCLAVALTAALASRSAVALQAEENPKSIAAADFEKGADPVDPDDETDAKLKSLIEAIRQQESRFRSYSATVETSRDFRKPDRTRDNFGNSDGAYLANESTLGAGKSSSTTGSSSSVTTSRQRRPGPKHTANSIGSAMEPRRCRLSKRSMPRAIPAGLSRH